MPLPLPTATIHTQVSAPPRFTGGYATAARVFGFDGLVDGRENLAFGWAIGPPLSRPVDAGQHRWFGRTASASPAAWSAVKRCDRRPQRREAVERIADSGGFLLYLRQDGFGVTFAARVPTGVHLSAANARYGRRRCDGSRVRSTSRSQRGEIALC
jgi:GTP cyclohydrolase II